MVQQESLREHLLNTYYISHGQLCRLFTYKQWEAGTPVGRVGVRGYKTLSIGGKRYYIHRLIYLMVHGSVPPMLDHIDGDKTNNKPENLRPTTKKKNALNLKGCHKDNGNGFLGVTKRADTGKYQARFRTQTLGSFETPEEAHEAYVEAKSRANEELTP